MEIEEIMHTKGLAQCLGQSKCPINIHYEAGDELPSVKKLPRCPQPSQWLISTAQSLTDPLHISLPNHIYSKESEVPQMSPVHTDRSLLYPLAHSCCLPLL